MYSANPNFWRQETAAKQGDGPNGARSRFHPSQSYRPSSLAEYFAQDCSPSGVGPHFLAYTISPFALLRMSSISVSDCADAGRALRPGVPHPTRVRNCERTKKKTDQSVRAPHLHISHPVSGFFTLFCLETCCVVLAGHCQGGKWARKREARGDG